MGNFFQIETGKKYEATFNATKSKCLFWQGWNEKGLPFSYFSLTKGLRGPIMLKACYLRSKYAKTILQDCKVIICAQVKCMSSQSLLRLGDFTTFQSSLAFLAVQRTRQEAENWFLPIITDGQWILVGNYQWRENDRSESHQTFIEGWLQFFNDYAKAFFPI